MAASKKSFKDNPALQFITTDPAPNTDHTQPTQTTQAPRKEPKSRRLNLIVQPSTMEGITKIAFLQRTSANDLINTIMREYVEAHADTIRKYDSIFAEEDKP